MGAERRSRPRKGGETPAERPDGSGAPKWTQKELKNAGLRPDGPHSSAPNPLGEIAREATWSRRRRGDAEPCRSVVRSPLSGARSRRPVFARYVVLARRNVVLCRRSRCRANLGRYHFSWYK